MKSISATMRTAAGFCEHGPKNWALTGSGPLANNRLAVKDLFAVQGFKNAAGNPDWYRSHHEANETAEAVAQLLNAGVEFTGFSQTDELAYSLDGNNPHYTAVENPVLSGHRCGGSSTGSAAAVAGGFVDIGLGTDTGGSIRVPASYCGLYGLRPSHGAVSCAGLIGLAPRFDTVGWLTSNPALLAQVGKVLLKNNSQRPSETLLIDEQLLDLVEPSLQQPLAEAHQQLTNQFSFVKTVNLGLTERFSELNEVFRILQGRAVADYHRFWLQEYAPRLSPAVAARIDMALKITDAEVQAAEQLQQAFKTELLQSLTPQATLFLPTTPTTAPKINEDTRHLRAKLLRLTAIAGLSGSAQLHLPLLPHKEGDQPIRPYGFSLLQAPGNDLGLLALAESVCEQWPKEKYSDQ